MNKADRLKKKEDRLFELLSYDDDIRREGYGLIAGVDEAGRGPLCGPVSAAAVILPFGFSAAGLDDSKKVSETERERLYDEITKNAVDWSVSLVDNCIIDKINILEATKLAMENCLDTLNATPELVLIDALKIDGFNCRGIIRGDAKSACIAAASIIAKVTRDRLMKTYAVQYPEYLLEKNKGYPTEEHIQAIKKFGLTPIHRKTFCWKFANNEAENED